MQIDWLIARPVAHRGLHDVAASAVENTASAFVAAIAGGYGIECDLQISADGEAMVHHDDALGRLTEGSGRICDMTAAALKAVRFKATSDRMLTLPDLCALVAGRTPLVIELKGRFDGDRRLVERAAAVLTSYPGPAALMSFDPALIEALRKRAPSLPRGIVAERHYALDEWGPLPSMEKRRMAHLLHIPYTRPHFIAYAIKDLPTVATTIARSILRMPLLTWTVRNEDDRRRAQRYADQVIFEGWRP